MRARAGAISRGCELGRLRILQHALDHEAEILSDNVDLLIVVDLSRPTPPPEDEETCRARQAAAAQQRGHAEWTGAEPVGFAAGGGAPEHGCQVNLVQQPLFASCISGSGSAGAGAHVNSALQRALKASGVNAFPCALSTHMLGGLPTSVLATAAAASALLDSLDNAHFEAQGGRLGASAAEVRRNDAADGDALLQAIAALEPQRFGLVLPFGVSRRASCAEGEGGGGWVRWGQSPGDDSGSQPSSLLGGNDGRVEIEEGDRDDGELPWSFVYVSSRRVGRDGGGRVGEGLGWVRNPLATRGADREGASSASEEEGLGRGALWESVVTAVGKALADAQDIVREVVGVEEAGDGRGGAGGAVEGDRLTIVGYPGRLGNWLFRVAAGLGVGWDAGKTLVLPDALPCLTQHPGEPEPPPCSFSGSWLSRIERVADISALPWHAIVSEPGFAYSTTVVPEVRSKGSGANVALSGFFQSHRYFHHHRQRLLRELRLPAAAERQAHHRLHALLAPYTHPNPPPHLTHQSPSTPPPLPLADAATIALHVRRTDYAQYPGKHPMLPAGYYRAALQALEEVMGPSQWRRRVVVVFCDDPRWCDAQEWIHQLAERVLVVDAGAPDAIELRVMSLCCFLVIANSSFSWWAAYLSAATLSPPQVDGEEEVRGEGMGEEQDNADATCSGRVVAPAAWFGEEGPAWDPSDLFPPDWIVV